MKTRLRPLVTLIGIGLIGCGGGEASPAGGSRGLDAPDFDIAPQTEALYTVGALEGEAWETFGQVSDVAFDDEGNLFILDRNAAHVVMIDPAGEYVRTISNKGDGPGELGNPFGMVLLSGGRVAVFDFAKFGFQLFGPDGEFLESVAFDPQDGLPGSGMVATPGDQVLSAGGVRISMGGPPGETEETPPGRPIERFGLDGSHEVAFRAWEPPPPEEGEASELATSGGGRMRLEMPRMRAFEPPLHIGVLSDGRIAVADSVAYRIKLVAPDGSVTGALERPVAPTPVSAEIEEAERTRQADLLAGRAGGGGATVVSVGATSGSGGSFQIDEDAIRRMMEDRVADMVFFPEIPVVARMGIDHADRVWVERAARPGQPGPTDILTADGQYLGTIAPDGLRIPAAFGPGGLMAYIETDELEIQRVRVARLAGDEALEGAS